MNRGKIHLIHLPVKWLLITLLLSFFTGNTAKAEKLDQMISDIVKNEWSDAVFTVYGDTYVIELPVLKTGFTISASGSVTDLSMEYLKTLPERDFDNIRESWDTVLDSLVNMNSSICSKMRDYNMHNPASVILIEDVCGDGCFDDVYICIINEDVILDIKDIRKYVYILYNQSNLKEAERELNEAESNQEKKTDPNCETESKAEETESKAEETESEPPANPTSGTVTGTITYLLNDGTGHKADINSFVILIPADAENADLNTDQLTETDNLENFDFGKDSFFTEVNELGTYMVEHIPAGEYLAWIVSGNTCTSAATDMYDIVDGKAVNIFFRSAASEAAGCIPEKDAYNIARAIGTAQSHISRIKVYRGETTILDYDFAE